MLKSEREEGGGGGGGKDKVEEREEEGRRVFDGRFPGCVRQEAEKDQARISQATRTISDV